MRRVVVTGMGVVSPNANNIPTFEKALKNGQSGIRYQPEMEKHNFRCQVGGIPEIDESLLEPYFSVSALRALRSTNIQYACLASLEAYKDAGLQIDTANTSWDTGCIYGCSISDVTHIKNVILAVDEHRPRTLGSRYVAQCMTSGPSAYLSRIFGFGNHVFSNSSACSTGTESLLMAYERIKSGLANRMLAGSCEPFSLYSWGAFDSMRVLNSKHNDQPEAASRPFSQSAGGFVPGSGAATLILEDLATAQKRGAKIYAEILGGAMLCGGQRMGGTMTAPNSVGVQRCIQQAIQNANIQAADIDLIVGHLTATMGDKIEVNNWREALGLPRDQFPYINSLKSMIGHCLSAAGSIECVGTILQLYHGFVQPNINCEDLHEEILQVVDENTIPRQKIDRPLQVAIKANFGFGDVNSCIVLKKYEA
ncbi:MAG: beta-ketoacyl-[acyl-carrier-protein] synthase family protein [Bacteroidota bacterium]